MKIYYLVYAILCFTALIAQYTSNDVKHRNKTICITGFLLIFFLLALRHRTMGIDLGYSSKTGKQGYLQSFQIISHFSWEKVLNMKAFLNYEKGYIIFNKLLGCISNSQQFLLIVCAFINISVMAVYIYKKSKLPLLSWLVFLGLPVFLMMFSGLRQCIAISITMLSLHWVENKKPVRFILTVLLANTFHSSAIIFLIAYPMYNIELSGWKQVVSIVIIPIIYVLRGPLFTVFSKIFKEEADISETGAGTLFIIFFIIYVGLLIINNYNKTKPNKLLNLFYIACICQSFSGVYELALRVGYYFMIYLAIALPNEVYNLKLKNGNTGQQEFIVGYMLVFAAFVVYGIYAIATATWAQTNPYHFFWETVNLSV